MPGAAAVVKVIPLVATGEVKSKEPRDNHNAGTVRSPRSSFSEAADSERTTDSQPSSPRSPTSRRSLMKSLAFRPPNGLGTVKNISEDQLWEFISKLLSAAGNRTGVNNLHALSEPAFLTFRRRGGAIETMPFTLNCLSEGNSIRLTVYHMNFRIDHSLYGFNPDIGCTSSHDDLDSVCRPHLLSKASQRRLIGRGTSVRRNKLDGSKGPGSALAVTWQVIGRRQRKVFIQKVWEEIGRIAPGIHATRLALTKSISNVELPPTSTKPADPRRFRHAIAKRFEPLHELGDSDFKNSIIRLVECVHLSSNKGAYLHKDICFNNLAYYNESGEIIPVLMDSDSAMLQSLGVHRTGTACFMAFDLLEDRDPFTHNVHHDLESLFYCLLWQAAGYRGAKIPRCWSDPLIVWREWENKFSYIGRHKRQLFESDRVLIEVLRRTSSDSPLQILAKDIWTECNKFLKAFPFKRGMSLSFKMWMRGAGMETAVLAQEHADCQCCD